MKILLLTHSFNCLTQRVFIELTRDHHDVSVELDISDAVTIEAVTLFQPDLIIAPFLKRAIPEMIWRNHVCLIVHPGIVGDRGPSALDWAIMKSYREWGVTVLQANAQMDAGDIWAAETFPMRFARKSDLYRHEVVEAAVIAVKTATQRFQSGYIPIPLDYSRPGVHGRPHAPMRQVDRSIDWQKDSTDAVLAKIYAADGFPGVLDTVCGQLCYVFDAYREDRLTGMPGAIIAKRNNAICRATIDGAVWLGHLKTKHDTESMLKLAATMVLRSQLRNIPEISVDPFDGDSRDTYREVWCERKNDVAYLHFAFYNGAMDTAQCERLRNAYRRICESDVRVIVLMGGREFWCNGIHLNHIEYAGSPADESWRNINAMNDLVQAIITTEQQLTIAALQGNAGAGGVFFALAADYIFARESVIFNPHYKNMGNLYGSEYWTYLLPRRVDASRGHAVMNSRLPIDARGAKEIGLIDDCLSLSQSEFRKEITRIAEALASSPEFFSRLQRKKQKRRSDEREKPLQNYRDEELQRMRLNFYGFDPSYHVARYHFVYKIPPAWTPRYLTKHRRLGS